MKRRTKVPERIVELIDDLETLTELTINDWTISIDEEEYDADPEVLKQVITISPHEYRVEEENQEDLNEMRRRAGLETVKLYGKPDSEIQAYIAMAGL